MSKCPKCHNSKILEIDYCLNCGNGDLRVSDLDSLKEEELEYAARTPCGKWLIKAWKQHASKVDDTFLEGSTRLHMNMVEYKTRLCPNQKKIYALVCVIVGGIYATAKHVLHYV